MGQRTDGGGRLAAGEKVRKSRWSGNSVSQSFRSRYSVCRSRSIPPDTRLPPPPPPPPPSPLCANAGGTYKTNVWGLPKPFVERQISNRRHVIWATPPHHHHHQQHLPILPLKDAGCLTQICSVQKGKQRDGRGEDGGGRRREEVELVVQLRKSLVVVGVRRGAARRRRRRSGWVCRKKEKAGNIWLSGRVGELNLKSAGVLLN